MSKKILKTVYLRHNTATQIKKYIKLLLLILIDVFTVIVSVFITNVIRDDSIFSLFSLFTVFVFVFSAILFNLICGCYQYLWKYIGLSDALRQCSASILNFLLLSTLIFIEKKLLKSDALNIFALIDAGLCIFIQFNLMILFRFSFRIENVIGSCVARRFEKGIKIKVIVYCKLDDCRDILERTLPCKGRKISALISTTPLCEEVSRINGIRIQAGDIDALEAAIKEYNADEIIISEDILNKDEMIRIYKTCYAHKCLVKIYVGIEKPAAIRDINLEDLLGRKQTVLDMERIKECIRERTILVTGGAGSIGSEICRQVLDFECKKLVILDVNENGLFELDNELKRKFNPDRYEIVVGSVRDNGCLSGIFIKHQVDTVFHAAAYKHVPLMEANPAEAIKNNIFGTLNVSNNAVRFGAEKFILISTDKAVNCKSIMGATKRIAEILVQLTNQHASFTKLATVRFGNVLGSNGSVIPTFRNQIKIGGPVTVTHPDVERYFMTIMEAVQLVLQAGYMARGWGDLCIGHGQTDKDS